MVVDVHGDVRTLVAVLALAACPTETAPPPEPPPPGPGRAADATAVETVPAELDAPPGWARRRMYGHLSPAVALVSVDGGVIDGTQLTGKRRFIVYWDYGDRVEEAAAVDFLQVLQKAQPDLSTKGFEVMFVHLQFPGGRKAPMNDTDLRRWQKKWTITQGDQELQPLPQFRFPNATEFNPARVRGLEKTFTVREALGESPAIVILDKDGLVRWHSEGIEDPEKIGSRVPDPEQATIIAAIEFALKL